MSFAINNLFKNIIMYPLVWGMIVINIGVFVLLVLTNIEFIDVLFMPTHKAELASKLWTVITPSFIHYTFLHLCTNVYLWWLLGAQLEQQSKLKLVGFVFITATLSNCAQWLIVGPKFAGFSGVVYGLLGFVLIKQYFKQYYFVEKNIAIILLCMIPLGFTNLLGNLSNYAHIFGLLSGIMLGFISVKIRQTRNQ